MIARLFSILLASAFVSAASQAQSPAPIIVQAMPAAGAPVAKPLPPVAPVDSSQAAMKILQEIKAANDAVLTKQAATLQQIDELEKATEQIKIYTKRG